MDFVAIDIGASNTRYLSNDGKVRFISNNMSFVQDMGAELFNRQVDNVVENNLDVTIIKDGESEHFPVRALVGNMAMRTSSQRVTPSQRVTKISQRVNYVSIVLSIALSKLHNSELGNDIRLFTALPPIEVNVAKVKFAPKIKGKYTVVFNKFGSPTTTVEFNITDVSCYAESQLAVMQFLFDEKHPENLEKYGSSRILSVDIGASTTDLVVFDSCSYLEHTGRTEKIGGNVIRDRVIQYIQIEHDITEVTAEMADKAIIEGILTVGNSSKDVSAIISKAKQEMANDLNEQLDKYFTSIHIPLQSINYILVSGGGSLPSSYINDKGDRVQTSSPLGDYLIELFKKVCPDIDIINFGDEPRLANIRGLGVWAMIECEESDQQ